MSLYDRVLAESFLSGDARKRRGKVTAKATDSKWFQRSKHKKQAWKSAYRQARRKSPGGGSGSHHEYTRGVKRKGRPGAGDPRSGHERIMVKNREGQRRLKLKLQMRRAKNK